MKHTVYCVLTFVFITMMFSSCTSENDVSSDQGLLVGKWKMGTLHYKYNAGGTGTTWDTIDDVAEEEGKKFNWTLDKSTLTHIYILDLNTRAGDVPKVYTVTKLTETELQYKDEFDKSWSFVKVK